MWILQSQQELKWKRKSHFVAMLKLTENTISGLE